MKRWIAMILALAMVLGLTACGSKAQQKADLEHPVLNQEEMGADLPEHMFGRWLSQEENRVLAEIDPDGGGMVLDENCIWAFEGTDPEGNFSLFAYIDGERRYHAMVRADRPEMMLDQRIKDSDGASYTTIANLINEGFLAGSQGAGQDDLGGILPEYAFGQWASEEAGGITLEINPDGTGMIRGENCTWVFDGTDSEGNFLLFAVIDGEHRFHAGIYPDRPEMVLNQRIEDMDGEMYTTVANFQNKSYENSSQDTEENVGPQVLKDGYLVPEFVDGNWVFNMSMESSADVGEEVKSMEIVYMKNGSQVKAVSLDTQQFADAYGYSVIEFGKPSYITEIIPIEAGYDEIHFNIRVQIVGEQMNTSHEFKYQVGLVPPVRGVQTLKDGYQAPRYVAASWIFECELENTGSTPLTVVQFEVTHMRDGKVLSGVNLETGAVIEERWIYGVNQIADLWGTNVIQPGQQFLYQDAHPIVEDFNEAAYIFTLRDESGRETVQTFLFQLSTQPPLVDYTGDTSKDVEQMYHDADFEIEVADGIYWVPVSALGQSRYTNGEIFAMLSDSPEEKQASISTLYEALQLYRIGGFYSSDDNVRIFENGLNWEHHKPGYDAVRTNNGCCATDSNWLHYLLEGDYEEVGYIATSQRNGSGHVYNYIYQDGWYYTVDLTYQIAGMNASTPETGDLADYTSPVCVFAAVHKCRSLKDYALYCQKTQIDPPGLMFRYVYDNVPAIDSIHDGDRVIIADPIMPGLDIQVIFDDPNDNLTREYHAAPNQLPNWDSCSSFLFPG